MGGIEVGERVVEPHCLHKKKVKGSREESAGNDVGCRESVEA